MTLATLADVLQPALKQGYAVGGLVTLGWEDMRAYVAAAEAENCPVILQAGPSCRAHTPLPVLGKMFRHLAETSSVPVVAHLDHGYTFEDCRLAIDSGFTSVMFDGSRKPLQQNIDETAAIAEMAHAAGISCEGEIGFVGYSGGEGSDGTNPEEAAKFARDSAVDAMAISVGNVHLQQDKEGGLDLVRIAQIEALTLPAVGYSWRLWCASRAAPASVIKDVDLQIQYWNRIAYGFWIGPAHCGCGRSGAV